MKKFVDGGMFLQMKITLIICQKKNKYFNYKSKWWLHLNKSGSDTLPLRKCSDFKEASSTLGRSHQEDGGEQFAPTPCWKNKQWKSASSSSSTWWEWHGGLLKNSESQGRGKQSLGKERGDPLLTCFGENLRRRLSRIQFILLQMDRLQLTVVYCNRRGVQGQHLK